MTMRTGAVLFFLYSTVTVETAFVDSKFNKYVEYEDFSGLSCPAEKILFTLKSNWSALCGGKCSKTPNCLGLFVLSDKCIGCNMHFTYKTSAPTIEGSLYYRRQNYIIVETKQTWEKAKIYCEILGGHLADIKSEEEEIFVEKHVVQSAVSDSLWIGGTDVQEEGTFLWLDGTKLDDFFTNWKQNEPDNENIRQQPENCLRLKIVNGIWKWGDTTCEHKDMSLCEVQ